MHHPDSRLRPSWPVLLLTLGLVLVGATCARAQGGGFSLRFFGNGVNDIDRVKIRLDDPNSPNDPGPPADIGAEDFTIEFWMRATAAENPAAGVNCGFNINWIFGNIVLDRDRFNQDRKWGISIAGGLVVFGVSGDGTGDRTICSVTDVLDDAWHHVAASRRRSDGRLFLHVDGSSRPRRTVPTAMSPTPMTGCPAPSVEGPASTAIHSS